MKKLIIIPAYNESANIEKTVASIKKDAKGFDYVIINDCSVDNTRKICEDNRLIWESEELCRRDTDMRMSMAMMWQFR